MPGRTKSLLERAQTFLRCRFRGHYWVVQEIELSTHRLTLICSRCQITHVSSVPKVKLRAGQVIDQPKATEH